MTTIPLTPALARALLDVRECNVAMLASFPGPLFQAHYDVYQSKLQGLAYATVETAAALSDDDLRAIAESEGRE